MNWTKPALEVNVGGTLTFDVPDSGVISSATVSVFDQGGNAIADLTAVVATVSGSTLSVSIPGTDVKTLARNYRAEWTYTIGGVSRKRNTTFEVVAVPIYQTLTTTKLTSYYARLLNARFPPGVTSFQNEIDRTWETVCAKIRGYGKDPNYMIDPRPLEHAHALYAAALIASNYSPGRAGGGSEWQDWAAAKRDEADRELDLAMANLEWYNINQTKVPAYDEENSPGLQVRVSR